MARKPATTDENARVKEAVAEARRRLARLTIGVVSWSEPPSNPDLEFRATVALFENILGTPVPNRDGTPAPDPYADLMGPLTSVVRQVGLPALKRLRPARRSRRGKPAQSDRDAVIMETIKQICRRYGFRPTRNRARTPGREKESGCSIVAKALNKLGIALTEKAVEAIWIRFSPLK